MQLDRKYIHSVRIDKPIDEASYISQIPAIRYLAEDSHKLNFNKNITMLVGENGTGKSTILEAIAVAVRLNPEGGSSQHMFSTHDTHSELGESIVVSKQDFPKEKFFLRAESAYNLATYLEETSNFWELHNMSHGESFIDIISSWHGKGLYLMDEPEAALSPFKLMQAMCIINNLLNKESQFIIATHSPMLLSFPDAQVLQLTDNGIEEISYRDTEHYKITLDFLLNPERMFSILFDDDSSDQ